MTDSPASNSRIIKIIASAGSGKTYQLTQRFLDLLLREDMASGKCRQSASFDEILAITFTNAAASEMQDRVLTGLKETALGISGSGNAGRCRICGSALRGSHEGGKKSGPAVCGSCAAKAENVLNNIFRRYSALNIRTIDSLLDRILRVSVLDLGLPPDYEIRFDEEAVFEELLSKACIIALKAGDGCGPAAAEARVLLSDLPAAGQRSCAEALLSILASGDPALRLKDGTAAFLGKAEIMAAAAEKHSSSAPAAAPALSALRKEIADCRASLHDDAAGKKFANEEEELITGSIRILSLACEALLAIFQDCADSAKIRRLTGLRDQLKASAALRRAYMAFLDGEETLSGFMTCSKFKKKLFHLCEYLINSPIGFLPGEAGLAPEDLPFAQVQKALTPPEELRSIHADIEGKRNALCCFFLDLCERERLKPHAFFTRALNCLRFGGVPKTTFFTKNACSECLT